MTTPRYGRKRPGHAGKTVERARYVELTRQGLNNSEICRMLGIGRKTGCRWRNGHRPKDQRTGRAYTRPPIAEEIAPRRISARFLSEDERMVIADMLRVGASVRSIAAELGRSPSTVSREVRRNKHPCGKYRPHHAHSQSIRRRSRSRPPRMAMNTTLRRAVEQKLAKRWSPKQISWQLSQEHPDDPAMRVAPETIYQALYRPERSGLDRDAHGWLRRGRSRRKNRRGPARRGARFPGPVLMIDQRPEAANSRSEAGHWEGDLVMGAGNRSAVATLVERRTRHLILTFFLGWFCWLLVGW